MRLRFAYFALSFLATIAFTMLLLVVLFVLFEALPVFADSSYVHDLFSSKVWSWRPLATHPQYSISPLLLGTLKVSFVAIAVAGPLGVLSAIYVFYLPKRWSRVVGSALELSASFPSVAIALFAYVVVSPALQSALHTPHRLNALLAGFAVSLAIVPIVCTLSLQALSSVPPSLTDAALALGSTRIYALVHVVLQSAFPGILASIITAFSRAMGETVIVLLVAGNGANIAPSLGVTTRTVSGALAIELPGAVSPLHVRVLFLLALFLVLFSILANYFATRILEWPKTRSLGRP